MIVALIVRVLHSENVNTSKKLKKGLYQMINMLITFFHLSAFFPLHLRKTVV